MANGCKVDRLKHTPILRARIHSTILAYSYFIFNPAHSDKLRYKYVKKGF